MTKIFSIYDTTYVVKECTAIASTDNGENECRQEALFVTLYDSKTSEVDRYVVFGYEIPETVDDFMEIDDCAWENFDQDLHEVIMR